MENTNHSVVKAALNYGIITGIILVIYSLITWLIGQFTNQLLGYVPYIILLVFIVIGTKEYREELPGKAITYGTALGYGTLLSLYVSIFATIFSYLFLTFIDPDIIEMLKTQVEEEFLKQGIPDEQIEMTMKIQNKLITPIVISIMNIFSYTFIGFVISLITSAILKKEPEETNN